MKNLKSVTMSIAIGLASSVLGACASNQPEPQVSCDAPDAVRLDQAVAQAKATLAQPQCSAHFDGYFQDLLRIGQSDPDAANKAAFRDFIAWSHEQGLVGKLQGKTVYTRYFHRNFVSLPNEYNNCAAVCPDLATLERDLKRELLDKHRGTVKVLGDKDAYQLIDSDYNGVLLMLDATCQACDDARQP